MDIQEEGKRFIFAKGMEDNKPFLINRKDIIDIEDVKIEVDKK